MLDENGKPKDKTYLEKNLPPYLVQSISQMNEHWEKLDSHEIDNEWDLYWCNLNADINSAEIEQEITNEQARYLRKKYLRMESD